MKFQNGAFMNNYTWLLDTHTYIFLHMYLVLDVINEVQKNIDGIFYLSSGFWVNFCDKIAAES